MEIYLVNREMKDLNPLTYGIMQCRPGYRYGPMVRPFYLVHYVLSGKGIFYKDEGAYPVKAGEFFMILPGEVTSYEADREDPWKYLWLYFEGETAKRLENLESPVGPLPRAMFDDLIAAGNNSFSEWGGVTEEYIAAILHRMIAEIFIHRSPHSHHARRAETYIRTRYSDPDLSVEGIAAALSLDRHHLARLFKARYGMTMREYLINTRIHRAAELLREGHSVTETTALCGYTDLPNFSKMFRRHFGVSPGQYRKRP